MENAESISDELVKVAHALKKGTMGIVEVLADLEDLLDEWRKQFPARAAHLAWCKQRALEYVDAGDLSQAMASMGSDLNAHPETQGHTGMELGMMMMMNNLLDTPAKMREWIEGFN